MKTVESLVLQYLRLLLTAFLDPLQFAYQPNIGVEDAITFFTLKAFLHLEKQRSAVRAMFFSSLVRHPALPSEEKANGSGDANTP